ncbi:hypothetical protein L7F22_002396 [Adiantum nelumboides]|nr:hypothetical protein [Adiantum nelumboides]
MIYFCRDVLEDTPKRDDIVYLVKKRWERMKRPIHGFGALLHPIYKKPSLFSDQVLNEKRIKYLPKVLKEELHGEFLQEVINYGDQRGTAFASAVCWKRESLVNVDECKLSVETLKSLNKDLDPEEEQIFRELYMELEEIDRRVSRTRARKVVVRGLATRGRGSSTSAVRGRGRTSTRAPTTYVRRGSGSGSSTTSTTLENVPLSRSTEPREPEFDDEGNILSEGDYGLSSTHSDPSSDEDDTHHDSDWETDTSTWSQVSTLTFCLMLLFGIVPCSYYVVAGRHFWQIAKMLKNVNAFLVSRSAEHYRSSVSPSRGEEKAQRTSFICYVALSYVTACLKSGVHIFCRELSVLDCRKSMPEDWESFDPAEDHYSEENPAKEETMMLEEFQKRRERNRIKEHLYGRRRPVDGWKYIINHFGKDEKGIRGSVLSGDGQTTGDDLEKLALKRETGRLRRKA